MKVLFACPWIPWPLDDGGRIRTYNLLKAVARHAEVHLRVVLAPGQDEDDARELEPWCASVRVFSRGKPGTWTRWARPKIERWFHSPGLAAEMAAELATGGYDLVHLDELLLARSTPADSRVPVVQHHHKLDTVLYSALAGHRGVTKHFDLFKLRRLERESARLYRHHVVCSEGDARILTERYPRIVCTAIPSGYDPEYFRPEEGGGEGDDPGGAREPATLVFVGSMGYGPNVDAAVRFVREILPGLRATRPELRTIVVGKDPSPEVRALAGPGVQVTGAVPDVRPYLRRATAMVVPLRIGGGTRLKIVEAMGAGTPVVSTYTGAEGLALEHREHLLLAGDNAAFAACVNELLDDPHLARDLARRAHERVSRLYTWPVLGASLVEAWRAAAGGVPV